MPVSELLIVKASTDGTNTSGTCNLVSQLFQSTVTYIQIPKGLKAKIWFKEVAGEVETKFKLQYTNDVTAGTPTWVDLEVVKLASKGELTIEKRRPVVIYARRGTEAIRVVWEQPTAGEAHLVLAIEITDE